MISAGIWYNPTWQMMLDIINMCIIISSCEKLIPRYSIVCMSESVEKRYIDNQKVQVADEIKRDIWKYLV